MAQFTIDISYSQVCVFDARLTEPFNGWSGEHVSQGFAWRPGSVSFGTLAKAGPLAVDVARSQSFDECPSSALRAIAVPFTVPDHGGVEVASIGSGASLELPPGEYELTFEHGLGVSGQMWARFSFRVVAVTVTPRIIRADAELSPPDELVMTAAPAR